MVQRESVDLLLAPERPEPAIVEPQPVQEVLEYSCGAYDYVVVDLGSVCESMSMATLSVADSIYLVCSSDLGSLFMMRRSIPLIEEMGYSRGRSNGGIPRRHGEDLLGLGPCDLPGRYVRSAEGPARRCTPN